MSQKWLAIYSRPRWEKKVARLLQEQGIEVYCPLNKVRRKWSDRMKTVEEPLFKSYLFVKVIDNDRTLVRMTAGVVNFVYIEGKPAVIREKEIVAIKKFLNEYEDVDVVQVGFSPNQQVVITAGIFMGYEGKILSSENKYAKVAIESLGCILVAKIEKKNIS